MIRKRLPKKTKRSLKQPKLAPFNATSNVEIERISHDGNGLGFSQGYTVSVPYTLVGEQVVLDSVQVSEKLVSGKVKTFVKESEKRITPNCEYFERCGGCDLQHTDYQSQINIKQEQFLWQFKDLLFKDKKNKKPSQIDAPIISEPFEYRQRIRLSVIDGQIGFLQAGSNRIVEVESCSIAHPLIQQKLKVSNNPAITEIFSLQSVEWLLDDDQNIAIRLIMKKMPSQTKVDQVIQYLQENGVKHYRFEGSNQVKQSDAFLIQRIDNLDYQYLPGQFTQVNLDVNTQMLAQAQSWILDAFGKDGLVKNSALDLFCGMGNFTLMLAKHFDRTIGLEGANDSIDCANQNAQNNSKDNELNNLRFIKQDLFSDDWAQSIALHKFDLVVLDPPRAGAKQICTDIEQLKAQYVLYISCNQSTLKRDAILLKERGYGVDRANIMDMFAQTHHIETMVLFKKM